MSAGPLLRCLVKTRRQKATENFVQTGSWEYPRKMGICCFWHRQAQPKGTKSGKKSTKSGKRCTKSGKKKPMVNFAECKGIRYSVPSVFCTQNVSPCSQTYLFYYFLFSFSCVAWVCHFCPQTCSSFLSINIFFKKYTLFPPFFLFFFSFFFLLSSFLFLLSKWT